MADKVEDALHPERKRALQVVNGSWQSALRLDAGAATHPIVQTIDSVDAANQAFDAIAYDKGSAIVRMLEDVLGEDGFREGIRRYVKRYAYGNATTDELWAELAAATGQPVADIAHDFTRQPGVPLVSVARTPCADGRTSITLSQGRFETGPRARERQTWRIPVRLESLGSGARTNVLLGKDGAPATTTIDGCSPVVVNAGQAGYFRTRYAESDLTALAAEFDKVAEIDRLGLLNDAWALGEAGELPVTSYLELAEAVPTDSDPVILIQLTETLTHIDRLFDGSAGQTAWRAYARSRLQPVFARIGWTPVATESEATALLRESLIRSLGRFDDAAVLAEARHRFARSRTSPDALPAAIREAAIAVVARHADDATWNELLSRARAAAEPIEQQRLFAALGLALDPALVSRALTLAVSGGVPSAFASEVIDAASTEHPKLVFDFAVAHEKQVLDLVDIPSRWLFIPALAETSAEPAMIGQVRDYAQRSIPADARQTADRVVADTEFRAAVKARQLPALQVWVAQAVAGARGK
jgi:aminopeptidase N